MKLTLPKNPHDRHTVVAYAVDGYYPDVVEHRFVYHVNTPMRVVVPEWTNGHPFRDEWACYRNGRLDGRIPGWDQLARTLDDDADSTDYRCTYYESRLQALDVAIGTTAARVLSDRRDLKQAQATLSSLVNERDIVKHTKAGRKPAA